MTMRRHVAMLPIVVFCFGASSTAQTPRPPSATASLAGVVSSDDAGTQPIRRARVTLRGTDGLGLTTTSDDNGRFVFRELPAGRYQLAATKAAWLVANYGAKRPGRPGTPIVIGDGQRLTGIALKMTRGAVITGTVRDPKGRPADGMRVQVVRVTPRQGELVIDGVGGQAETDDTGAYRIFGLPPGDFMVAVIILPSLDPANPPEFRQSTPEDVSRATQLARSGASTTSGTSMASELVLRGPTIKMASVLYPGVTDPAAATTLTLAPGEEKSGIDIPLQFVPTAYLEGVVTNANGAPESAGMVVLSNSMRMASGLTFGGASMGSADSTGRYRIGGVGPGEYIVAASTETFFAQVTASVAGLDVFVPPLVLQPNPQISGRVMFDDVAPSDASRVRLTVTGFGAVASIAARSTSMPIMNNTFRATVLPGRYQIGAVDLPAGWFLKSAIARGRETLDTPVELRAGDPITEWTVTLTNRPSELAGTLLDNDGHPAPDYFIVAFSVERVFWLQPSRRIAQTRPASDGAFSIKGLPAGEYFLVAMTDVEPGESLPPDVLASLVPSAVRVTITDGWKTVQGLKLQR